MTGHVCRRCEGPRPSGRTPYCDDCKEAITLLYLGSPLPVWKIRSKYKVSDVSLVRWAYDLFGVGRSDIGPWQRKQFLDEYRRRIA
jgi:hypothetical protein